MHSVKIRRVAKKTGKQGKHEKGFSVELNGEEIADMISSWFISGSGNEMPRLHLELPLSEIDVYFEECEVSE